MRITNQAVLALGAVFIAVGLIAMPFDAYIWRLAQLAIVLVVGIILNAAGAMGAGDSKFIAVAAPFVAQGRSYADTIVLHHNVSFCRGSPFGKTHPSTPSSTTLAQLGSRQEIPDGACAGVYAYLLFGSWSGSRIQLRTKQ